MESKPWYESITIWGNVVTMLALVAGTLGYTISPEAQATIVAAASALAAAVGTVISIVGRKQADQPVHLFTPFTVPAPATQQANSGAAS